LQIPQKKPSTKGPAEMFTGDVWLDVITRGEEPSRMRVNSSGTVMGADRSDRSWPASSAPPTSSPNAVTKVWRSCRFVSDRLMSAYVTSFQG